jgi:hypothetical protein
MMYIFLDEVDIVRGAGPKNVKKNNGTYIKSDMPESINR